MDESMLQFDPTRHGFDEALELLCCLPKQPAGVALNELARDFGYDTDQPIAQLISVLKTRGYLVHEFTENDQPYACLDSNRSSDALDDARRYWQAVYGKAD